MLHSGGVGGQNINCCCCFFSGSIASLCRSARFSALSPDGPCVDRVPPGMVCSIICPRCAGRVAPSTPGFDSGPRTSAPAMTLYFSGCVSLSLCLSLLLGLNRPRHRSPLSVLPFFVGNPGLGRPISYEFGAQPAVKYGHLSPKHHQTCVTKSALFFFLSS